MQSKQMETHRGRHTQAHVHPASSIHTTTHVKLGKTKQRKTKSEQIPPPTHTHKACASAAALPTRPRHAQPNTSVTSMYTCLHSLFASVDEFKPLMTGDTHVRGISQSPVHHSHTHTSILCGSSQQPLNPRQMPSPPHTVAGPGAYNVEGGWSNVSLRITTVRPCMALHGGATCDCERVCAIHMVGKT